jgi:hypothetical protein
MKTPPENFEKNGHKPPLFLNTQNRNPNLSQLDPENRLKLYLWLIEIQDWEKYEQEKEITKKEVIKIYKKNRADEEISDNELLRFRAGITKFKDDPDFWKHDYSNSETYSKDEIVLLKVLYRVGVKNKVFEIINSRTNSIDIDEGYKMLKQSIINTLRNNDKLDNRASNELFENIWYMEEMDFPTKHQNLIFDAIQKIELPYRNKERKKEQNSKQPHLKELSINHLLRVQRITWGLLESAKYKNFAEFPQNDSTEIQKILDNPREMLKISLISLGHDLLEDNLKDADDNFQNPAKLSDFLKKIALKYLSEEEVEAIIPEVVESINRLNTKNFTDENNERDYNVYLNGRGNPGDKDYVRPLNFAEKLVKISDISHNYQTHAVHPKNSAKNEAYARFVKGNIHLMKLLPQRILGKFFMNNPELVDDKTLFKYWRSVLNLVDIEQAKIENNTDKHSIANEKNWDYLVKLKEKYPTS